MSSEQSQDKPLNKICVTTWCHDHLEALKALFPHSTTPSDQFFAAAALAHERNQERPDVASTPINVSSNLAVQYICFGLFQLRLTESEIAAGQMREFIHKIQEADLHLRTALRASKNESETEPDDELP